MYKITLETMALETINEFSFETKKEANKKLKELAKEYDMTKSPMGNFWNTKTFLELNTNY